MPVIIWINGGFGAGKTTLAQELCRRLPDAVAAQAPPTETVIVPMSLIRDAYRAEILGGLTDGAARLALDAVSEAFHDPVAVWRGPCSFRGHPGPGPHGQAGRRLFDQSR